MVVSKTPWYEAPDPVEYGVAGSLAVMGVLGVRGEPGARGDRGVEGSLVRGDVEATVSSPGERCEL